MSATIEVRLKSSPQTSISATAIDERSNKTMLALVGLKAEIVVIARDNIAVISMDSDTATKFLATQLEVGVTA